MSEELLDVKDVQSKSDGETIYGTIMKTHKK